MIHLVFFAGRTPSRIEVHHLQKKDSQDVTLYVTGVKHKACGPNPARRVFHVAPDVLKRHVITFSYRNLRKISCAFILKVSN